MSTQVHATLTEQHVRAISEELGEPDWLLETRLDALEALETLPFPDVIQTPGRTWTDLSELDFEALVEPSTTADEKEREAPEEVDVLSFAQAVEDHEELLREQFGSVVDPQTNYLTALQTALFTSGTVIYVPDGVDAESVTIRTTMDSQSLFNYTLVVVEQSSSVTILERQETGADADSDSRYYSGIVELVAGENSYVQYGSLQDLSEDTYNYQLKRASTDTYANADWIDCNIGSRLTKTSVETTLAGEASESKIVGAFYGHNDQHFDVDSRVWHENEHTTADLVTRGVIDDDARSVYEGVQDVGSEAWNTNSYQRENTLMLSDESEADASPKLIINNHDTEASHSATVGQVDANDLFYMTSRGVSEHLAKNMLVSGFFVPVLDEIEVEELREDVNGRVQDRLQARS
ncbi:Fe-S cluster assembly protein SufD [Halocatena pleomorpha]|uniref:Fe-S cluster assembly protein SufD n=1 Tax=Halocatena pleomorpha TaxID=1785090 RepID=A0A3P3R6N9_9EURY|nr:Fe-S cluster assembly protein SufD [Halocatena pleomorpha]RRJ29035.1 Fe-S cluster assembly protein SufD [Halocatena pleomorpha]